MELGLHLHPGEGEPLADPTRYRHLVASLVYLGITRADISYVVHILSQFVSAPTQLHYSHLLRVLHYLRGTVTRRLFFPRSSFTFSPTVMRPGPAITLIAALSLPIVFFLAPL